METDRTRKSLSTQVSYYNKMIASTPGWVFAGVFADCGISGTHTANRTEFQAMLTKAHAGGIDLILTKSISRFARNTVDLLETVRELKSLGVEVRFEREDISSTSADGELMLTLLASFAQAESEQLSQNVQWRVRKGFEQGKAQRLPPLRLHRLSRRDRRGDHRRGGRGGSPGVPQLSRRHLV